MWYAGGNMKLFSSNDRNLTHKKLEDVLADGRFPNAFCQDDNNAAEVYQIFHGLEPLSPEDEAVAAEVAAMLAVP
jgi:hypothetical protein